MYKSIIQKIEFFGAIHTVNRAHPRLLATHPLTSNMAAKKNVCDELCESKAFIALTDSHPKFIATLLCADTPVCRQEAAELGAEVTALLEKVIMSPEYAAVCQSVHDLEHQIYLEEQWNKCS